MAKYKKAQAFLLGGVILFIILVSFIASKIHQNFAFENYQYIAENIENEFERSANAFFLTNNTAEYMEAGIKNYSITAQNFAKENGFALYSYYIIVMPNISVIFGNYFDENINASISINNETSTKQISIQNSAIFYFNNSANNTVYLNYSFNANQKKFAKNITIQNNFYYIYWIKLIKQNNNILINEIAG